MDSSLERTVFLEQQTHSKVKHIEYKELKLQPCLYSPLFSRKEKSVLFRLRSCTIAGIKSDFGNMYDDESCPVCTAGVHLVLGTVDSLLDTIPGLLSCPTIVARMQKDKIYNCDIKNDDIFLEDVAAQKVTTAYFIKVLENRDKLQSQDAIPVNLQASGPVHCSTLQVQFSCK